MVYASVKGRALGIFSPWLQFNKNCGCNFSDCQLSRSFAAVSVNSLHFPQMLGTPHRHLKGTKIHKKSIGKLLKKLEDRQ